MVVGFLCPGLLPVVSIMNPTAPTPSLPSSFVPRGFARCDPTLSLDDILAAQRRLQGVVRNTPCCAADELRLGVTGDLFLKHEHLQHTRSFKERGAANVLLQLRPSERRDGVVAASAGNHGLGLAWHGARLGVPVTLVIPADAPHAKVDRCRAFGAQVELCGETFEAADFRARELAGREGRRYVHPFDDLDVMAGQGTVAVEFLEQVPGVEVVFLPVGGGGLLAGAATAIRALRPDVAIVAVEPANAACYLAAQQADGRIPIHVQPTLADGLAVSQIGAKPYAVARGLVDLVVTVSEYEIAHAMVRLFETERIVAEGAGAAALAGLLSGRLREFDDCRVVALVGGANVDAATFARALQLGQRAA